MARIISGLSDFDRSIPGSTRLDPEPETSKMAGIDHCAVEVDDGYNDLMAEVEVVESPGWASRPR